MSAKLVSIRTNNPGSSAALDLEDALNRGVYRAWAVAAILEGLNNTHRGNPFIGGAIQIVDDHINELEEIRAGLERLRKSELTS